MFVGVLASVRLCLYVTFCPLNPLMTQASTIKSMAWFLYDWDLRRETIYSFQFFFQIL